MFSRNSFLSLLTLVVALAIFTNAMPMNPDGTLDEYEELQRKMLVCKTGGGYTGSMNYQLCVHGGAYCQMYSLINFETIGACYHCWCRV